ncbi:MAG: hypothetical protein RBR07_11450 [Arcobacteraceae bacterium]|nr:hypothetical protein [Arcobacteraceae bacterium]
MQINSNSSLSQQYLTAFQNKQAITSTSFEKSYESYQSNKSSSPISREEILEQLSHISNNDNFNEKISQVAKNMNEEDLKLFTFVLNESPNMDEYNYVILSDKDIKNVESQESVQVKENFSFKTDEEALDFIDMTLEHLELSIKNNHFMENPHEEKKSQQFFDIFTDIKSNYIKTIDENNATLGIMTKYERPISLEELQKQKEQEQINLAMQGHELDPKSDLDKATFKFMQEGYSKTEAIDRAMAYKGAGLIPNTEFFEKFGVTVYSLSFIAHNPAYKKALEESFEKMTTEQIKGVSKTIGSSDVLSIHVNELSKILPKDEDIGAEEVMRRMDEYWNNRYGSPEKMMAMFDKVLRQNEINQKFSTEDLTYVEDGINILIETYKKNEEKEVLEKTAKKGHTPK